MAKRTVKRNHLRLFLRYVLPLIVLTIGVAFLLWTYDCTLLLVHLRRPGTTTVVANVAAYHYESDTYVAGWICLASALGWWLLPWRI